MKFIVRRTSSCDDEKPCEEAIKENMIWFIEINSLEELLSFEKKYGDIIISESWHNVNVLQIEIYDGYRERRYEI